MTDAKPNTGPGKVHDRYPLSLGPLKIGPVEVPNRLFMGPHGLKFHFMPSASGGIVPTANCAAYYEERAAGGAGLILHSFCASGALIAGPNAEADVPAYAAVADAVHRHGAKIFAQLWLPEDIGVWDVLAPMRPPRGPSGIPHFGRPDIGREIPADVVAGLSEPLGKVAGYLARAGYDGIEVHAAHGHLIEQFLSPYFNQRSDRYGGDDERRLAFLFEVIAAVRRGFGPGGAIGIRFNPDEMLPGGIGEDHAQAMLTRILDRDPLDFVNLGTGVAPRVSSIHPHFVEPLHERGLVERVGSAVRGRTVLFANPGRVTSLDQSEGLLSNGLCDMVGMVRGLIAEPRLVNNARKGHPERSRICVAGSVCSASGLQGAYYCELNPAVGREASWGDLVPLPDVRRGKVVVAGGGPAGLEAARVAARLGHEVAMIEQSDRLGGQLLGWGALPGREHRLASVDWYRRQLDELEVTVRLGSAASAEAILAERPDAVIVATGASYDRLGRSGFAPAPLPGWDRPFVLTPEDVLAGRRPQGEVVVIDEEGLHAGAGMAELLALSGCKVEYVTSALQAARSLVLSREAEHISARLQAAGVTTTTRTAVREIGDRCVVLSAGGSTQTLVADAVVLVTSRVAGQALDQELVGRVAQVFAIGDALAPRTLAAAAYEGQRFARLVGAAGAPATSDEAMLAPGDPSMAPRPAA
jgi:2,4-dienoyl-CoA reductase-like NADH-dependent reductase (Old Yellow Enzyme family)